MYSEDCYVRLDEETCDEIEGSSSTVQGAVSASRGSVGAARVLVNELDNMANGNASDVPCAAPLQVGGGFPASASLPDLAKVQQQEIAALVQQLQDAKARVCVLEAAARVREQELADGKVHEQLRATQRELDQTKRESAAKIKRLRATRERLHNVIESVRSELRCPICRENVATRCYPCSHVVCEVCGEEWWARQEEQRRDAEYEQDEDILPEDWFQCPVCRTLTGDDAVEGLAVRSLMNIVDML